MTRRGRSARPSLFRARSPPAARPAPPSRRWRSPTRSSASTPAAMSPARVDRAQLRAVQTPQAFAFAALLDAHRRAAKEGRDDFTDDAALAEWAGIKVAIVRGRSRQREAHHRRGFRQRRGAADRKPRRSAHSATASTCMPSATAIMSGSAASRFRTTAGSPAIPTPTSRCTRWSTRSSARSPTATSACISRRTIRAGAARRPISS